MTKIKLALGLLLAITVTSITFGTQDAFAHSGGGCTGTSGHTSKAEPVLTGTVIDYDSIKLDWTQLPFCFNGFGPSHIGAIHLLPPTFNVEQTNSLPVSSSNPPFTTINVGNVLTWTVNGLDPETEYCFEIQANWLTGFGGGPAIDSDPICLTTEPLPDTTIPVITLIGDSEIDILYGSVYVDLGATALDDVDGDITSSIVTVNPVDTFQALTTFIVTYDVTDSSGNAAEQVTRIVNVGKRPSSDDCVNCQMPSIGITSEGKRVVDGGITVNGNTMNADYFFTPFPLIQADIGEQITMSFVIWDDYRDNIAHVEVGLGKGKIGESFAKLENSMFWNRHVMTKEETITYDETMFDNVSMKMLGKTNCLNVSTDSTCDLFQVIFTPIKPIVGDVVFGVSIWDDNRNAMTHFFNEGLQIGTIDDLPPVIEYIVPQGPGNGNDFFKEDPNDQRWTDGFKQHYAEYTSQMEQLAKERFGY